MQRSTLFDASLRPSKEVDKLKKKLELLDSAQTEEGKARKTSMNQVSSNYSVFGLLETKLH